MSVRPGYKRTEVGIIPEDWDVSTVGQQFSVQLGKMLDAKRNVGVAKPYLGNRAVQWNRIDIAGLSSVPLSPADLLRFRLEKGDLLACEGGEVGRAAIWDAPFDECYYQKALHRLRPLKDFDPRFMVAILHHLADRGMLANYVTQTSIAHLPRDKFIEVPIPPPPVAEQHAVATALSDVDELLGGLDRLIAKKRDLKQAAMQQLLTGKTRLPGFSGKWDTVQLGDLLGYERPDRYIVKSTEYSKHGEIPVLTANKAFILGYTTEAFGVCADLPAIVFDDFTTDRKFATVPFKVKSSAIKLLRPRHDRTSLRFMFERMQQIRFRVGDHKRYYISDYQNIRLPIPEFDEQLAIVSVLSDMDGEISVLEARRDKTRDLKQGMMQELLTGRTRLI